MTKRTSSAPGSMLISPAPKPRRISSGRGRQVSAGSGSPQPGQKPGARHRLGKPVVLPARRPAVQLIKAPKAWPFPGPGSPAFIPGTGVPRSRKR